MHRKPWLFCLVLLLAFFLGCGCVLAEEGSDTFVNPTRDPNAPEYSTTTPENLYDEQIVASSFILMERESGEILRSRNADTLMYPASTTKILTALIALQFCDDLDATLVVSETANSLPEDASGRPVQDGRNHHAA